jgi:hypothetical protein
MKSVSLSYIEGHSVIVWEILFGYSPDIEAVLGWMLVNAGHASGQNVWLDSHC